MIEKKYSKILEICYKKLNEVGIDPVVYSNVRRFT